MNRLERATMNPVEGSRLKIGKSDIKDLIGRDDVGEVTKRNVPQFADHSKREVKFGRLGEILKQLAGRG